MAQAASTVQKEKQPRLVADWTLMVYLDGDNNISAAQGQVMEHIRQAGASSQVNIAILIDQNQMDDTRLYYLNGTLLVQQEWETESMMDSPATINAFVDLVKADLPATYYALYISSNKGCGWQGVCWDDHGRGQMITMPELIGALNRITEHGADKIDIIGIETCMTGNMEVAYQINSCVDYFLGYSECGVVGAWPYEQSFNDLKNDSTMTPHDFAVNTIGHFVPVEYPEFPLSSTMSATDLSLLPSLGETMDDLGIYFINNLDQYKDEITTALEGARIYALSWDIDYYIDIYNFLDLCTISDPAFTAIKDTFEDTMDTAVIANAHMPDDPAHGLSIYFPRRAGDYNDSLRYPELPSPYEATMFANDTHWEEFLRTYLGIANNSAPTRPTITGPAKIKVGTPCEFEIQSTDPEDQQLTYYIDWGDGNSSEWIGPYDSGEQFTVNYTWQTKATYTVKVKARDILNAESDWGTLTIKVPILGRSRIILIGKLVSVEKDPTIGFRFVPEKVLQINHIAGEGRNVTILKETYGEYPCCAYIPFTEFKGIVTKRIIAGVWQLPS